MVRLAGMSLRWQLCGRLIFAATGGPSVLRWMVRHVNFPSLQYSGRL
ncbi:hypothetical protein I552_6960 [Mycobacterium xenopi 3993]|nr:hypothetical protein I552_6960 [Mycobacterium xenopi 3993]